jgi:LemA protein
MKSLTLSIVLIAAGLLIFINGCGTFNTFVDQEENVSNAWSKVQSEYQRRSDLIPNLVNTVRGYADFEQETLTQVMEARARATQVQIDPANLTPEALNSFQNAQAGLSQSLGRLLVTIERYPELKANQNFLELQAQLEGTENRIRVARNNFNDAVTNYNRSIRRFPNSLYAGIFGFDRKAQFEADQTAQTAPKVEF